MALSASALQLAGFLMVHAFWTISDQAPGDAYVPQALCETDAGERRLVSFDAPTSDESLAQARSFMGSAAGQFAECAFTREAEFPGNGGPAHTLVIQLSGRGQDVTVLQAFNPASAQGGFHLLGDEVLLDRRGVPLPRSESNPAIVSLREGAADHPGTEEQWAQWNTGRDPVNPLVR